MNKKVNEKMGNRKNSNIERLFRALAAGKELTTKQIRSTLNIANPRATVSDLREHLSKSGSIVDVYKRVERKSRVGRPAARYLLGVSEDAEKVLAPFGVQVAEVVDSLIEK